MDFSVFNKEIAILTARIFLGCLFFFQGYDALFRVKMRSVVETFEFPLANKGIPKFLLVLGAWFTSLSELTGGFLLMIGLFSSLASILLAADLVFVAITFSIIRPMWDMQFVFPRLLLLLLIMFLPREWDIFSLDYLLNIK